LPTGTCSWCSAPEIEVKVVNDAAGCGLDPVEQSRRFLGNARGESDPYYVAHVLMLVLGLRRVSCLA
jgi:hypothetical protein